MPVHSRNSFQNPCASHRVRPDPDDARREIRLKETERPTLHIPPSFDLLSLPPKRKCKGRGMTRMKIRLLKSFVRPSVQLRDILATSGHYSVHALLTDSIHISPLFPHSCITEIQDSVPRPDRPKSGCVNDNDRIIACLKYHLIRFDQTRVRRVGRLCARHGMHLHEFPHKRDTKHFVTGKNCLAALTFVKH